MTDINNAISKAKVNLYQKSAVICYVIYNLELIITKDIKTAGTDGKHLYINPDFFLGLTSDERVFILYHEGCHVFLLHGERQGDRNHKKWNVAGDAVINQKADKDGCKLIKDCVTFDSLNKMLDKGNKFNTWGDYSTEEVYDHLKDLPDELFEDFDSDVMSNSWNKDEAKKNTEIAKSMGGNDWGEGYKEFERMMETLHKPLPWYKILWNKCEEKAKDDYSWVRPSRRYTDVYLPGLYSESLSCQVFIDNSGSIDDITLNKFYSQLTAIKAAIHVTSMDVYFWSTEITDHYHFDYDSPVKITEIHSTGGTDLECLKNKIPKTGVNIILTDGCFCDVPEIQNRKDIIWVIYDKYVALSRFKGTSIRLTD